MVTRSMNCDMWNPPCDDGVLETQSGGGPGAWSGPAGASEYESFLSFSWDDVHDLTSATVGECYATAFKSEQGMVFAEADVTAREVFGAALAEQDFPGVDDLTAEALHTKTLGVRVTTVTWGTSTFFCCHDSNPFPFRP